MEQQEVKLTIPASAAQYIVGVLEDRPHREVRALIDLIVLQANAQLAKTEEGAA